MDRTILTARLLQKRGQPLPVDLQQALADRGFIVSSFT